MEMRVRDGVEYTDKNGKKRIVSMWRYPKGAQTRLTEYRDAIIEDKKNNLKVQVKQYRTPYEGEKDRGFISFYTEKYDDEAEETVREHSQMNPQSWATAHDWKPGDGMLRGVKIPDTTPIEIPPEIENAQHQENMKQIGEKAKSEGKKEK